MYQVFRTNSFEKDIKTLKKRGKNFDKLKIVVSHLVLNKKLPNKHIDHKLSGNWSDFRECHIEPDWLLIYRINENTLELVRTGAHSDLF